MAMVVCMCLGVSSCTHRNREIEEIAQRELGYYKDFYVIALQTGRVKLPKGGQNPHVTHPGMGGVESGVASKRWQIWRSVRVPWLRFVYDLLPESGTYRLQG